MRLPAIVLVAISVFLAAASASYHSPIVKTWGKREPYDYRIHYQIVNQTSSYIPFSTASRVVNFPIYQGYASKNITFISAIDQVADGYGSSAILTRGGIGFRNATITFTSPRSRGFNFILEVFGR